MRRTDPAGYCVVSAPGDPRAKTLIGALEQRGTRVFGVRTTAEDALPALWEACGDRTGLEGLAAFQPCHMAALALAIQRRVDRLALVLDGLPMANGANSRLRNHVRRNLGLCASDVLLVEPVPADARRISRRVPGPVLSIIGEVGQDGWTECEFSVKCAICDFLLPDGSIKSLAENAEMCIIYR